MSLAPVGKGSSLGVQGQPGGAQCCQALPRPWMASCLGTLVHLGHSPGLFSPLRPHCHGMTSAQVGESLAVQGAGAEPEPALGPSVRHGAAVRPGPTGRRAPSVHRGSVLRRARGLGRPNSCPPIYPTSGWIQVCACVAFGVPGGAGTDAEAHWVPTGRVNWSNSLSPATGTVWDVTPHVC